MGEGRPGMLILQETITDESGSLVVYAPLDISAMQTVMNGGDATYIALRPSGFSIVPNIIEALQTSGDGNSEDDEDAGDDNAADGDSNKVKKLAVLPKKKSVVGCILSMSYQVLVNKVPTEQLSVDSIGSVKKLISCTLKKVKAAVNPP